MSFGGGGGSAPQPVVPQEDPAVTAARNQAQAQADAGVTQQIQSDLQRRMQSRLLTFGLTPNAVAAGGTGPSITSGFMRPV